MKTILAVLALVLLASCASPDAPTAQPTPVPISGKYSDSQQTTVAIDQFHYQSAPATYSISNVDLTTQVLEIHLPTSWGPYFLKWTFSGPTLYVCIVINAALANPVDLVGGCNGAAWNQLTPIP